MLTTGANPGTPGTWEPEVPQLSSLSWDRATATCMTRCPSTPAVTGEQAGAAVDLTFRKQGFIHPFFQIFIEDLPTYSGVRKCRYRGEQFKSGCHLHKEYNEKWQEGRAHRAAGSWPVGGGRPRAGYAKRPEGCCCPGGDLTSPGTSVPSLLSGPQCPDCPSIPKYLLPLTWTSVRRSRFLEGSEGRLGAAVDSQSLATVSGQGLVGT